MKKKVFTLLLSLLLSLCVFVACDEPVPPLAIEGFEVEQSITVSYGESVEVEEPIVSDASGTVLDVWSQVTDSEGNFVEVVAGRFRATDTEGYTITYVVRASDNYSYQKTTVVTVTGGAAMEIELTADYEQIIDIGSTVTINPVCSISDANYEYTVLHDEQPVTVTNGSFVAEEGGVYSVTIEVEGTEYSYEQVAIKPMQKGEVEVFDEYWQAKEKALGGSRQYEIVTTQESGIRDRFGREGTFATFTTSLQYPSFYIYPRGEKDYYESLAEEGYTKVSYWIYMESEKNISHITRVDRDPNGKYFMGGDSPTLLPNTWVEITINLVDSYADYNRSFVSCYDFYREGTMKFMLADNGVDNGAGMGDTMTFYIADIYAVKSDAPVINEDVSTTYKTGDTLDFAEVIDAPENYDFFIESRGITQIIEEPSFTFTANGTYNLTVVNKTYDLEGKANLIVTVTDDYEYTGNYPIIKRTTANQTVTLADFNAGFTLVDDAEGNLPTVENYAVTYNGTPVAIENGEFVALFDGSYDVEISGTYEKDGATYTSFVFATVDIYSDDTKYSLLTAERMVGVANSVSAARPEITEGVYEIGGREGNMIKVDRKHSATSLYFKPLFSKNYYEQLLADEPTLYLNLEFYKDGSGSNHYQYCYLGQRDSLGYQWNGTSTTAWGTKRTLENFVSNYDNFVNAYNAVNTAIATATWYDGVRESDDAQNERLIYTWITDGAVDLYIDGLTLVKDATETTLALADGVSFNAETTYDVYELLSAELDGVEAEIIRVEVNYNDQWVRLTESKEFTPVWNCAYEFRVTARANGLIGTTNATISTSGTAVEITNDDTYRELRADGLINIDEVINLPDYDFEYVVTKIIGTSEVATDITVENGVLLGSNEHFEEGLYKITAWASKPEFEGNPFNNIAIYSLYVDFIESENSLILPENLTNEFLDAYTWTNCEGNEPNAGMSARLGEYDGKDVIVIGGNIKKYGWAWSVAPIHSKGYYEKLLTVSSNYTIMYEVLVETEFSEVRINNFGSYSVPGTEIPSYTWTSVSIPLTKLIENYTATITHNKDNYKTGSLYNTGWLNADSYNYPVISYIANIRLGYEATVSVDEVELELGTTYDLTEELNAKINDESATITKIELKDGDNWIEVPDITAFNSSWNVEYTARVYAQKGEASGVVTTTVKVVDEEGNTFAPIAITSFNLINESNATVDLTTLNLPSDYTYTYSAQRITYKNGKVNATAPVVSENNLSAGSDWTTGQYEITIVATVDGGLEPFNSISYATFIVDYDETDSFEYVPVLTQDTISEYTTLMNQWGTVTSYDATIVDNTAIGGKVNDISLRQESKSMWAIQIRPVHSKAYYEAIVAENSDYALMFDFYTEKESPSIHGKNFAAYLDGKGGSGKQWTTISIPLTAILEYWDGVTSTDRTNAGVAYLNRIFAIESGENTYLSNVRIGYRATATVSEISLLAGETHDLSEEITATINEQSATVKAVDIKENGLWVRVPDITSLYTPFNLAYTARITSTLSDGAEAVNEVAFKIVDGEGEVYETLVINNFNLITDDGNATVDLTTLNLPSDYTYTYTASKVIGTNRVVATAPVIEGNTLAKASDWTVGAYEIEAQAKDENAFAPIGYINYAIFTVDYDESENVKTYIKDLTQETLQTYTLKYYNTGGTSNSMNYVNEGTYAGRTVINLFDPAGRDNTGYQILPLHSKAYYEAILADNEDAAIYYDIYIASTAATITYGTTGKYSDGSSTVAHPYEKGTAGTTNTWFTTSIPLSTLIEKWDYVSEFGDVSGYAWVHRCTITTGYHGTKADFYLSNFRIGVETTEEVTATAQTLTLGNTYDLTQVITAKIGENDAIVTRVEILDGTDYIEVPSNVFAPSWNVTYTARVTALYDGAFGTTETTITVEDSEGNSFTPVVNTDLHLITDDGTTTVDLTTLNLSDEYDYVYTAKRIIGANKVDATAPVIEGNTLAKASDWTAGAYEITATATKADGLAPFNSIAYATFIVDYDLSESTKVFTLPVSEDMVATYLHSYNNWGTACDEPQIVDASTITDANLVSGGANYLKVNVVSKSAWGVHFIPLHSKAYYQAIVTADENATLKYDLYNTNGGTCSIIGVRGSNYTAPAATWCVVDIKISNIVGKWEDIVTNDFATKGTAYTNRIMDIQNGSDTYIGNFRIDYTATNE